MTVKVIGAGFGRTGTLSLKLALEQLGFDKCYHMLEVHANPGHAARWRRIGRGEPADWHALFAGYQATVDWPSCNFWREQMAAFPEAKVILSVRDPERWYTSVMNTIYPTSVAARERNDPGQEDTSKLAFELIWEGVFAGRMVDKDHVIGVYQAHNEEVEAEVPPEKLLVLDPGDGWVPLCTFLNVPVPDTDYPHVNSTDEFRKMVKGLQRTGSPDTRTEQ